jgi:2-(3-amino-3-carboxypropyl)histidine synthase
LPCFIYRYDPYNKKFTEEFYDHVEMRNVRKQAISEASNASRFGLILGTLGRQGSTKVMEHFQVHIGWNTQTKLI